MCWEILSVLPFKNLFAFIYWPVGFSWISSLRLLVNFTPCMTIFLILSDCTLCVSQGESHFELSIVVLHFLVLKYMQRQRNNEVVKSLFPATILELLHKEASMSMKPQRHLLYLNCVCWFQIIWILSACWKTENCGENCFNWQLHHLMLTQTTCHLDDVLLIK